MTTPEILLAATRYEKVRKLDPREYTLLWGDSLFTDTPFDELVDALPEPFRTKLKEEPKTCQTCKHWIPDTVRNGESLATSMGKCKEIFKNLAAFDSEIEGNNPFLESFVTKATFGCNGYKRNFFGDGNL
jgi:hypothetical protein